MKKEKQSNGARHILTRLLDFRELGVILPLIIFLIVFPAMNANFFSGENIVNILRNTSFVLMSGVGMTILLITGAFDLSIGAQIAFAGVFTGLLLQAGIPVGLSILLGLGACSLIGVLMGFFCVSMNIPPFISGIGMTYILKGIVLVVRQGAPVYPLPDTFNQIGNKDFLGIPYIVIVALIVAVAGHIILTYTKYGRKLYAVGGNSETSRLAGIRCSRIKFSAFIIVSFLTGLSGILTAARLGAGHPSAGTNFDLMTIAGCIIGGTSLFGGAGTILGTTLGALLMSVLTNGMTLVRVSPYWQQLVLGIIIIASVGFDMHRTSRKV